MPILKAKCAGCHTNGTYKGGLSLDTREAMLKAKAVVPGKAAESELVKRITTKDPDLLMPQKAAPLDEKQIAVIKRWIDEGAVWESGFSFKPPAYVAPLKPRKVSLPAAVKGREHPVDRIIDAHLAGNRISPPQPLDDAAFLRRVHLDLVGQLPAPGELDAFLADKSEIKREADPEVARRQPRFCGPLVRVLERSSAERLRRHRVHRWRPQADHRLALQLARGEQSRTMRSSAN
ncbi:MAG: c-type cytochrome domain-containing protein [Gemmataceae bacterium]